MIRHLIRKGCFFLYREISFVSFVFLVLSVVLLLSQTADASVAFTPPTSHPRVFINKNEINNVKGNLAKNPKVKEKILLDALSDALPQSVINNNSFDISSLVEVRKAFEANAFLYLLNIDPATGKDLDQPQNATGRKSIALALDTLSAMDSLKDYTDYDNSQACGRCILGAAFVYDWCYNLLTQSEKNKFIGYCESLASKMEVGYPPNNWGAVTGHSSGSPLMVDLLGFGVASYNEKSDMYKLISDWFLNQVVPARNFWYPSGMQHQGDSYGTTQLENTMLATLIFDRMGYKNVISSAQGQVLYRWIYTRRPDGQFLRNGDSFICDQYRFGEYWKFPFCLMLASSYYKDTYIESELNRQYSPNITDEPLFEAIFYTPNTSAASITKLPLTRFFGYPMGSMIARTGWDEGINFNSSNVVAEMNVNVYQFNGHQHLDSGQFQIYYKGALAIDSGIYNGKNGGYGSLHDANYYKRTIAHNSMLVYDPNEVTYLFNDKVANDGGQRWPSNGTLPDTLEEVLNRDYQVGSVVSSYIGPDNIEPDFSYLQGDLTKAYSKKVKDFRRSFVFMNFKNADHPAALIVYDKVQSSNKDFKKYWILHSVDPPYIENNVTTIARDGFIGNTSGVYNGKLVNHTLIPDINDLNIEKVGGSDNRFSVFDGKGGYKNYPNTPLYNNTSIEPGSWRVQISPKTGREFDRFLNVMEILDYKDKNGVSTKSLKVQKIDGDLVEGAKIYDRVVLFNKSNIKITDSINFNIENLNDNFSTFKFFLTDLSEGSWVIKINGNSSFSKTINVSQANNVLEFEGPAGQYMIYKNTSLIVPDKVVFDMNSPADIMITLENDETLLSIKAGAAELIKGTDYVVSGNTVKISKGYYQYIFGKWPLVTNVLTFNMVSGKSTQLSATATATVSLITPGKVVFDMNNPDDVIITIANGETLSSIKAGAAELAKGTDYIVSGNTVKISKGYYQYIFGKWPLVTNVLTFNMASGKSTQLSATADATVSLITPDKVVFDMNNPDDVIITIANGETLSSIKAGAAELAKGTDYIVSGNTVKISKGYYQYIFGKWPLVTNVLTFNMVSGKSTQLSATATATVSLITPGKVVFDMNNPDDVIITIANGETLSSIKAGAAELVKGTDYIVSGNAVKISKGYYQYIFGKWPLVTNVLTFNMVSGKSSQLSATASSTVSLITPGKVVFDMNNPDDVIITIANGEMLSSIKAGAAELVKGTDYIVSGNTVKISKGYYQYIFGKWPLVTNVLTFNMVSGKSVLLSATAKSN